jgi:predicted dehydrogenase
MRVLTIGCGSIGSRHIQNLDANFSLDQLAYDVDTQQASEAVKGTAADVVKDLDDALGEELDAALVCTPNHLHLDIADQLLQTGADLFIEKPLSHSLEGVDNFLERAESRSVTVMVGCNMRFHPPVLRMRDLFNAGRIGDVEFGRLSYGNYLPDWRSGNYTQTYSAQSEKGGGIVLDAVHEVDIALSWMTNATTVTAAGGTFGALDIDVEDTAEIILSSDDQLFEIHSDYLRPERARTYELVGSDGVITWTARGKNPERSTVECYTRSNNKRVSESYEMTLNEMYVNEMEHFLRCVRDGESPVVDGWQGKSILETALGAKEAMQTGTAQSLDGTPAGGT